MFCVSKQSTLNLPALNLFLDRILFSLVTRGRRGSGLRGVKGQFYLNLEYI